MKKQYIVPMYKVYNVSTENIIATSPGVISSEYSNPASPMLGKEGSTDLDEWLDDTEPLF